MTLLYEATVKTLFVKLSLALSDTHKTIKGFVYSVYD